MKNELSEKLYKILIIVYDMLKFAEAKNGILLAFCGTFVSMLSTFLISNQINISLIKNLLFSSLFFSIVSCFVNLLSFFPKLTLKIPRKSCSSENHEELNFYFIGDIKKFESPDNLLEALYKKYYPNETGVPAPENIDIARQLIVISSIVTSKFKYFQYALILFIASLSFMTAALICFYKTTNL